MVQPVTGTYRALRSIAHPLLNSWLKIDAQGMEHFPREGAFIVTPNHISNFDPVVMAYFMLRQGIPLRFMAKAELFKYPVVKQLLNSVKLIPVHRSSGDPSSVLEAARQALRDGEAVGIYPEGTLTRDPHMWPMKAKTGAARLALDTGVPVIPVAQWGAHEVIPRYNASFRMRFGQPITIRVLPPVDLSDLITPEGSENHEAVKEATDRILAAITRGVEEIRGEKAPEQPWDPAAMPVTDKKTIGCFTKWRRSLEKRSRTLGRS